MMSSLHSMDVEFKDDRFLPVQILQRASQGNPSVGGVKRKRGRLIEQFWTCQRLYLINGTRYN